MTYTKHLCSHSANSESCELEDAIEASHDGLFITDGLGNILMVNTAWERICGISREFVVGRNAQNLVNNKYYTESSVMAAIRARDKTSIMLEMTKGEKVGQKILATAIPIWGENGEIKSVVANIRDITEILQLKELLEKTQQLNEIYAAELETVRQQLLTTNSDFIARSPATNRVLEMAAQVAKVDSTVLITGESGVGKEIVAKAIHRMSPRSEGPLIMINCGAIPETLLQSELFGYESGAFTGARRQGKPGMFEMAEKGTLFLDEIGDISIRLQAKLLRAIQDHQIIRIGGLKPIAIDARIMAATNRDLDKMVQAGSFREDLYYRLNVVAIEIPPLRERKEDIPLLVLHFLKKINGKYRFQKRIASEVVDGFMMHQWPGNIRELENVIERMLVMTEEEEITAKHLPLNLQSHVYPHGKPPDVHENLPFKKVMERTEKHLLEKAIRTHGSTRKVARALKINQSTVVRKLKKYNLSSLCREHDEPESPFEDLKFRL